MTPKLMPDEDGDIPPCSVMYSIGAMNDWESFKESKYKFKARKAPCTCRYFEDIIPLDHKCYKPIKYSIFNKIKNTLKTIFRREYTSI
jgi:hypothetical protein